ncbi:extracellular solute-binding protein [Candidatus Peregrinibacteria bacterium]|nr:extracellular solute-binding protein [Candidatus Peregrinibacteria bacterium]
MNKRLIIIIGAGIIGLIIIFLFMFGAGCLRQKEVKTVQKVETIEITYYKLFDNSDVIEPLIQEYQSKHSNVKIKYRKFTNPDEYFDLILNELAEGEGPDIFSVPNTWFVKNYKKISPAPLDLIPPKVFEDTFVAVTAKDLIRTDPLTGASAVYGLPMTVDTLALYYNKDHFDDKIPERGKPSTTWEGIKEDVFKLTKKDNSFERFEVAGIAMGYADNISRASDILMMLIIQMGGNFYDANYAKAIFANSQGVSSDGITLKPGEQALELYTSFANPSNKNYSWNNYLADSNSATKEITTFARGKVSMIIGYSYMYEQIMNEIDALKNKGLDTVNKNSVKVAIIPQTRDPSLATTKRDAYAYYYVETVPRTSENSRYAWDFLNFITTKESLEHYYTQTHKPTSRRDMIEQQKNDPVYGVFAEQIGFAESIPVYDENTYKNSFLKAINAVLATKKPEDAMKIAQDEINAILPSGGLLPQVTVTAEQ